MSAAIDWIAIERAMLASFRGIPLTNEQQEAIGDAFRREPEEYGRRSRSVREGEIARVRRSGAF